MYSGRMHGVYCGTVLTDVELRPRKTVVDGDMLVLDSVSRRLNKVYADGNDPPETRTHLDELLLLQNTVGLC